MTMIPANFEPAVRDPKKLRRTAWVLVAIMVVGGGLIFKSYQNWSTQQDTDVRPAYIARITEEKDLPVIRQDGSRAGICDLAGKVSVIQTISISQPESAALSTAVMKRLAEHYAGNPDFALISLAIDPGPATEAKQNLATAATALGAKLPSWWVATNEPELLRKYVKKEFKANLLPHQADGRWIYDTSLVVIDRNRHIRRGVVPQKRGGPPFVATFDFDQAARWDAKGVKTGTELDNASQLEALLIQTIDELLAEAVRNS